jgi:adenylate cyclase
VVAYLIRYSHEKAGALPDFPVVWEYIIPPLIIGGPMALFDTNVLRKLLHNKSFLQGILFRVLIFFSTIVLTYGLIGKFMHDYSGKTLLYYMSYFVVLWGTGSVLLLAIRNLAEHFDRRQLYFWITGAYHRPMVEERIFLFIDLNDSTAIAERLGHTRYFDFLSDYFSLTARIIEQHHGEIYQHVGDEIIITWPMKEGIRNNNAAVLFFSIQDAIELRKGEFLKKYNIYPSIKGSLHAGTVTKGEITGKRREFIYTGDVLNATSRMQALCKPNEAALIISGELISHFSFPDWLRSQSLGIHHLRGRERPMEVHMIERVMQEV